jgi:hypothetical protein
MGANSSNTKGKPLMNTLPIRHWFSARNVVVDRLDDAALVDASRRILEVIYQSRLTLLDVMNATLVHLMRQPDDSLTAILPAALDDDIELGEQFADAFVALIPIGDNPS